MVFEQKCGHVALGTADTSQGHEEIKMKNLPSLSQAFPWEQKEERGRPQAAQAPWKGKEEAPVLAAHLVPQVAWALPTCL